MWINKKPVFWDQIRVNRGYYYHHGVYQDDSCVYQFAAPSGSEITPENALIISTTLDDFLKGGNVEVREYNNIELKSKRSPEEIIAYAKSKLGTGLGTYNLITNNCEHFSNMCAFGKASSTQVEDVIKMLFGGNY